MGFPNFCLCSVEQSHLVKAAQKEQEGAGLFLMGVSKRLEEDGIWAGFVWARRANQPLGVQGVAQSGAI